MRKNCYYCHRLMLWHSPPQIWVKLIVATSPPTGNASLICQWTCHIPPLQCQKVQQILTQMLQEKAVEPPISPWASPVALVRKKDGTNGFCINYRKLNTLIHKDAYTLPRINDTLDTLHGSQWFSTLDLRSG